MLGGHHLAQRLKALAGGGAEDVGDIARFEPALADPAAAFGPGGGDVIGGAGLPGVGQFQQVMRADLKGQGGPAGKGPGGCVDRGARLGPSALGGPGEKAAVRGVEIVETACGGVPVAVDEVALDRGV